MKNLFVFVLFLIPLFLSCELFEIDRKPDIAYETAKITHYGFDFSESNVDSTGNNNDGDVVNWSPVNPQKRNRLWYRPGFSTTAQLAADNSQKNMGNIPLDSIKTAPSRFDANPDPLIIGNSYVVKCLDGYAKFKVLDLGDSSNGGNWWADVEYQFSNTKDF